MTSHNASVDLSWFEQCIHFETVLYIVPSFTVVWSLLLFPLYFLVLHVGFQRRQRDKNYSVSHADFFTYNALAFELFSFNGYVIYSVASLQLNYELVVFAADFLYFTYPGLLSLHAFTCVERYLAVVYPVVYLNLKKQKWIWARSVIILVIWIFSLAWAAVVAVIELYNIPLLIMLGAVAFIVAVCSLRVLRALRNPSPGEGHGVSRSKRKAFNAVLAILMALMLWLAGEIISIVIDEAGLLEAEAMCKFQLCGSWFEFPNSLVLPLLFLQRAGKLPKCRGKERFKDVR